MPDKKKKKEKKDSRQQTPIIPNMGQALYQDPTTIECLQAPTGDLYAIPDKGKGKGSRRQVPTTPSAENTTYQDPNTIEHQQAPTGALYAMPEKKPKYSEVQKQNVSHEKCLPLLFLYLLSLFSVSCYCFTLLCSFCLSMHIKY